MTITPTTPRSSLGLSLLLALVACTPGGSGAAGTGGSSGAGGVSASGGAAGTGGSSGTGGTVSTGGSPGTGGAGTGGSPVPTPAGTGGSPPADTNPGPSTDAGADSGGDPAAARSPGCVSGQGLADGEATIMAAGMNRTYRLYLPKGYSKEKAWPLVLALHPNGGSGIGFYDGTTRPIRKLLENKAVLILPLARGGGGDWDWRGNLPADIAYFEELINRAKNQLCIDEKRIFSMGFSGGASFSGVLGCVRKDIRAIAVAGSVIYFDPKNCVGNPAAWIAIGQGEQNAGRTAFRDYWIERATCKMPSMAVPPSPCMAYTCPTDRPVHYCQHGGGHEWPGFASEAAVAFFDKF